MGAGSARRKRSRTRLGAVQITAVVGRAKSPACATAGRSAACPGCCIAGCEPECGPLSDAAPKAKQRSRTIVRVAFTGRPGGRVDSTTRLRAASPE